MSWRSLWVDRSKFISPSLRVPPPRGSPALPLHTGLRPGEALGLPWDAVNLEQGTLEVRQALHEEGAKLFIGELKGESAHGSKRRRIRISEEAIAALRRRQSEQLDEILAAGNAWNNRHNLVFTTKTGGFLRRTNILRRDLKRIKERVAKLTEGRITLEGVGLHTFRHTHASLLIFSGVDIKEVSARLGHTSVTFTYDIYGHLLPGSDERAARARDELTAAWPTRRA